MRIAMFVDGFPLVSETFVLRQITGLIDLGHEVNIFAQEKPPQGTPIHEDVYKYNLLDKTLYMDMPPESGYWEMPVLPITERTWIPGSEKSIPNVKRILKAIPVFLRSLISAPSLTFKVLKPSEFGYQATSLSALYRLSILCSHKKKYDILHAHFGHIGNKFRFTKELYKAPLVVSFHGYDFSSYPRKEGKGVYKYLFTTVDAITVNSDFTRRKVEEIGCSSAKIFKIPVGLKPNDFQFHERTYSSDSTLRILTIGRLTEKKGIEYSIRAVANVCAQYPAISYDIIGAGPLHEKLKELIYHLGMEKIITLHGAQNDSYIRTKMDNAHIFILASVTAEDGDQEGQGLVLQEAQASGLPILATDHNGFSESIVPGFSGFLVPERDVNSLAERLKYLIEHPNLWSEMGRAGRKYVEENYDISILNDRLVDLYKLTIKNNKAKHTL